MDTDNSVVIAAGCGGVRGLNGDGKNNIKIKLKNKCWELRMCFIKCLNNPPHD